MMTDFVFLPQVESISVVFSFASETIRLTGADSGVTTVTILAEAMRFPKPMFIIFIAVTLFYVLDLLADLLDAVFEFYCNARHIYVAYFGRDSVDLAVHLLNDEVHLFAVGNA